MQSLCLLRQVLAERADKRAGVLRHRQGKPWTDPDGTPALLRGLGALSDATPGE